MGKVNGSGSLINIISNGGIHVLQAKKGIRVSSTGQEINKAFEQEIYRSIKDKQSFQAPI